MVTIFQTYPYDKYLNQLKLVTRKNYGGDLKRFHKYLEEIKGEPLTVTASEVNKYYDYLKKSNLKVSSIKRNLSVVINFFNFLVKTERRNDNPAVYLSTIKLEKPKTEIVCLSRKDYEHLLTSLKYDSYSNYRVSLMILFAVQLGLGLNDISELKSENIDLENGRLYMSKTKGELFIPIPVYLGKKLLEFRKRFKDDIDVSNPHFFSSHRDKGTQSNRSNFVYWCREIVKPWCGWEDREFSIIILNNTFISFLIDGSMNLKNIYKLSRLKNFSNFQRYFQRLGTDDVQLEAEYRKIFD